MVSCRMKKRKNMDIYYMYDPMKLCELVENGMIDECRLRETSMLLSSLLMELDDWIDRVNNCLILTDSNRLLLDEAKVLYDEYMYITNNKIKVEIADDLLREIDRCELYSKKIKSELSFLYDDEECNENMKMIEIDMIELLLKEGYEYCFIVREFVQLQNAFSNVSTLVNLLNESIVQSNMIDCMTLIEEYDRCIIKIPNLYKLKSYIINISWINDASRYSNKHVNYNLVGDLLKNTPSELLNHTLYKQLYIKYKNAIEWVNKINLPNFSSINNIITSDTIQLSKKFKLNNNNDDEDEEDEEKVEKSQPKCTPEDIEELYNEYQTIDLVIPIYRVVDQVYHMYRRFKRHLKKVYSFLHTESNVNCTTECLLLLQSSKPLTEYVNLTHILGPLENDVEVSLEFEKKCRRVLNDFNTWDLTNECIKLRNLDWNSLLTFRKSNRVTHYDFNDVITLFKLTFNTILPCGGSSEERGSEERSDEGRSDERSEEGRRSECNEDGLSDDAGRGAVANECGEEGCSDNMGGSTDDVGEGGVVFKRIEDGDDEANDGLKDENDLDVKIEYPVEDGILKDENDQLNKDVCFKMDDEVIKVEASPEVDIDIKVEYPGDDRLKVQYPEDEQSEDDSLKGEDDCFKSAVITPEKADFRSLDDSFNSSQNDLRSSGLNDINLDDVNNSKDNHIHSSELDDIHLNHVNHPLDEPRSSGFDVITTEKDDSHSSDKDYFNSSQNYSRSSGSSDIHLNHVNHSLDEPRSSPHSPPHPVHSNNNDDNIVDNNLNHTDNDQQSSPEVAMSVPTAVVAPLITSPSASLRSATGTPLEVQSLLPSPSDNNLRPSGKLVSFSTIEILVGEFKELRVKNWQLYRMLMDIYETGIDLKDKILNAINDVRNGLKSDAIMSNIVLVSIQLLKYGALLGLELDIYNTLKYCHWNKKLYLNIIKYIHDQQDTKSQYYDSIIQLSNDDNINSFKHLINNNITIGSHFTNEYKLDSFMKEIFSITEAEFIHKFNHLKHTQ